MDNKPEIKNQYGIFTVILLLIIVVLLSITIFKQFVPSKECRSARQKAEIILGKNLSYIDSYEDEVYGESVSNINQQIFRINEYEYLSLENIFLQQQVLLDVINSCGL